MVYEDEPLNPVDSEDEEEVQIERLENSSISDNKTRLQVILKLLTNLYFISLVLALTGLFFVISGL